MSEIGRQIIAEVRRVAEAQPDFVFKQHCLYVIDGQPGCLIGQALWRVGLIDASLAVRGPNSGGMDEITSYLDIELDKEEYDWLCSAQSSQDIGDPWGEAVRNADIYCPLGQ